MLVLNASVHVQVDNREAKSVLKELSQAAMCLFEIKSSLMLSGMFHQSRHYLHT
jgi:hypothetical protein